MLFSVIKILLFLIAVGYSSGSGDYDNEDSEISEYFLRVYVFFEIIPI